MTIDGIWLSIIPTILFLLILLIGILFGIIRGFRKSLILAIQACVIFVGCLIAYLIIVNNPSTDANVVNIINNFNGENWLQDQFGVSHDCGGLKEILIQFIPNQMNMGDGIALILKDNGTYLMGIVNFLYHIIFAVLFYIIYILLIFIFYIIYLIAYPERRHKKKVLKKYSETDPNKKYKKHRGFGALVGGVRSFVSGFILVSLIGSIFYIAGGTGEKKYESYDWGDDSLNTNYQIYQALGSYGNTGIFKVLNTIKNQDNVPFYLFAANVVLSGGDVEANGNNLVLTRDLGEVSIFARNTFDLLVEYGKDDLKAAINNSNQDNNMLFNTIANIYKNEDFQKDFNLLIDNFNTNTFFVNMTFSVLDSFASHIDQINIVDSNQDVYELLNVLFNSNYKSEYIPDDELYDTVATIKPSMLLNKDDVKLAFNLMFNILSLESTNDEITNTVNLATVTLDNLDGLSILKTDNKDVYNPLFERLYTYLSNKYLANDNNINNGNSTLLSTSYLLEDVNEESIDWVNELRNIITAVNSSLKLFKSVYIPGNTDSIQLQVINGLYNIFDDSDQEIYNQNNELYQSIVNSLANSMLLGKVFATNYISTSIISLLNSLANNSNVYVPEKINYCDYEYNGEVNHGEIYNLFKGIESILKNKESKNVVLKLANNEYLENNDIKELCNSLLSDEEKTLNYLLDSKIVSSTLSAVVFGLDFGNDIKLVFPDSSKQEENGKVVNLLDSDEVKKVIRIMPSLVENILDSDDITKGVLSFATDNKDSIVKSNILCATVANYLINSLPENINEVLVINDELKNDDLTKLDCSKNSGWPKEINNVLEIFDSVINLDNVDLNNQDELNKVLLGDIKKLNEPNSNNKDKSNLDVLYESEILKKSLSKQLDDKLTEDIVDNYTKASVKTDGIYNKEELASLVDVINELDIDLNDTSNINNTIVDEVKNLNNTSTVKNTATKLDILYSSTLIKSALSKQLDDKLTGQIPEYAITDSKDNKYYKELEIKALVDVINELDIDLNDDNLASNVSNKISVLNEPTKIVDKDSNKTKLDILYSSTIVKGAITNEIKDEDQKANIILPNEALEGNYVIKDEIKALIEVISPYKNPDGSIDYSSIKDKITISEADFNEESGKYIKSKILHATISKYLADELNKDKTIVFSDSYIDENSTYIKATELQALVSTVCAINDSDFVGVNISIDTSSEIKKGIIKDNIEKSLIVRALITDTINESVESDIKDIYDSHTITDGKKVITSDELCSLIDVLAINSEDDHIVLNANIDINSYTIDKKDIETLRSSNIVSYKLTKEIENMDICGDDKKLPLASYSNDGYISVNELKALFDIVSENDKLTISNLKKSEYTSIDNNKIDAFKASSIVRYKITNSLTNDKIVIPDDVIETDSNNKKLILNDEYSKLIDALVSLGFEDSSSFDMKNITNEFDEAKAKVVAGSIIMRATLTEKLEITTAGISLYYKVDDITLMNNKEILVLTETEVTNILVGITKMGIENGVSIDINLDTIKNYNDDTLNTILKSNTLRYILSQIILSTQQPTDIKESVYKKNDNSNFNESFYTSEKIKQIIQKLREFTTN